MKSGDVPNVLGVADTRIMISTKHGPGIKIVINWVVIMNVNMVLCIQRHLLSIHKP